MSPIEDILIDKNYNRGQKKSGAIWVFLFVLIIFAALAFGAYYYFVEMNKETSKQLFLKGIANSEFEFFLENDTYKDLMKKVENNSYEMDNELSFSTTMENEFLTEDVDFSKYLLNLKTINNNENEESYNELNLTYSDNKFLNVKMIQNKEKVALISDEIVNKYVGVNKENAKTFLEKFGIQTTMIDNLAEKKNQISTQDIDFNNEILNAKKEEYINFLLEKLPEEKFSSHKNQISLQKENSQEIIVSAYALNLTQLDYLTIAKELLTKIKNDNALIEQFVTLKEQIDLSQEIQAEDRLANLQEQLLLNLLLGQKTEMSLEEVKKIIDEAIKSITDNAKDGNDLQIIVYASETGTEKISIVFSEDVTIDFEFNLISDTEKSLILTYLNETQPVMTEEEDVTIYSATDNNSIAEIEKKLEPQTNGIKLELYKQKNTASTVIQAVCNVIENKEINQKISLNLKTKGTTTSKVYNNEIIISYSNNDGEVKANITNKINFDKISEIEKLTEENCLFLDTLSEEELQLNIDNIKLKIAEVIIEKQQNLNFIDTNVQSPEITENDVNREELRNLLINTVALQMGDAQTRGEPYTIQNLLNLYIDGHMVTVNIQENIAEVSIDGVKFIIDENFNLSDA